MLSRGGFIQILRTGAKTRRSTPKSYVERVNRAIDQVVSRLDDSDGIRLEKVSAVAGFSSFTFIASFKR
jgi:hypothetical protein